MFHSSLDLLLKIQPTKLPAYKRQTLLVFSGNFRDHKFIIKTWSSCGEKACCFRYNTATIRPTSCLLAHARILQNSDRKND